MSRPVVYLNVFQGEGVAVSSVPVEDKEFDNNHIMLHEDRTKLGDEVSISVTRNILSNILQQCGVYVKEE